MCLNISNPEIDLPNVANEENSVVDNQNFIYKGQETQDKELIVMEKEDEVKEDDNQAGKIGTTKN